MSNERTSVSGSVLVGWACALGGVTVFLGQIVVLVRDGIWVRLSLTEAIKWAHPGWAMVAAGGSALSTLLNALPLSLTLVFTGLLLAWLR